jgi:hypothetical protein
MANHMQANALVRAGTDFNEATTLLEGGVSATNKHAILTELHAVQNGLIELQEGKPFSGVAAIHLQNVIDQLNIEITEVNAVGSNPLAPKEINDVHRDIIDIIQGDPALAAAAGNGFGTLPSLLVPPAQFHDNAAQTAFLAQFTLDSNSLGQQAVALVTSNPGPHDPAATALIHDIQAYLASADTFSHAQGGLFSARFDNELTHDGVAGTAGRALIDGIKHGDLVEVTAAAQVLADNASDVNGNNLPLGGTPVVTGTGIPAHFDTFGQVGTVFNDATLKLIGGIYDDGTTNNHASIVADLTATHDGLQMVTAAHPELFTAASLAHVTAIESLINVEIATVNAAGADPLAAQQIHDDQLAIIKIVQSDASLKALAAADNGFQPLPDVTHADHPHDALVAHATDPHPPHTDWLFHL